VGQTFYNLKHEPRTLRQTLRPPFMSTGHRHHVFYDAISVTEDCTCLDREKCENLLRSGRELMDQFDVVHTEEAGM
jgi:hypothetical protein